MADKKNNDVYGYDINDVFHGSQNINRNSREYKLTKSMYNEALINGLITPLTEEQKREHKIQKWVKPETVATGRIRYPKSGRTSREGNGYGNMTDIQKEHFIEALLVCRGVHVCCDKCGISFDVYQKALQQDLDFRKRVAHTICVVDEALDEDIIKTARDSESLADKIAARKLFLEIKNRSEVARHNKEKLRILEREVESKVKVADHVVETQSSTNFANLSFDELNTYKDIFDKIKNNIFITPNEALAYVDLTRKLSAPVQSNPIKALSNTSSFNSVFDNEDGDK